MGPWVKRTSQKSLFWSLPVFITKWSVYAPPIPKGHPSYPHPPTLAGLKGLEEGGRQGEATLSAGSGVQFKRSECGGGEAEGGALRSRALATVPAPTSLCLRRSREPVAPDGRAGPEAGLEPGPTFGAAGSLFPRPTGRQLPSPFPYWPASALNLFWISNPFREFKVLCNTAPGKMCLLGLTHIILHTISGIP